MTANNVSVRWTGDMRFDAFAHPEQVMALDTAPDHGGTEGGTRPVDMLLVSLAGCTAMDVLSIMRKKRQPVLGLEVRVVGKQRDEHPRVFTDIDVLFIVDGEDVQPGALERAIELSMTKYCPVAAMLGENANITTRYEIRQLQAEP